MSIEANVLMTVAEVARYLRVPMGWVYQHARPGRRNHLPSLRIGKYRRFRIAEVNRWLELQGSDVRASRVRDRSSRRSALAKGRSPGAKA